MIITFKQMPTNININNISGATPFNVYLCDESNITCVYINTIPSSSLPYNFQVPSIMEGQVSFNLKVVDNNGCTSISNILLGPPPSPTPTTTPTNTITPTITPTNTVTPTITPSITPTNTQTITPTNTQTPTITPTNTQTPTPTNPYAPGNNVFVDDFTRSPVSPGGVPSIAYTSTVTNLGSIGIGAGTFLRMRSDTGSTVGRLYTMSTYTLVGNPNFYSQLNLNPTIVNWSVNVRNNYSTILDGFNSGLFGQAVILASGGGDVLTSGNGYALVYGGSGTRQWRLVSFTGGLQANANITTILSTPLSPGFSDGDYLSLKVSYDSTTNSWSLYFRNDGSTAFVDSRLTTGYGTPSSSTNSTYTNITLDSFGYFYNFGATTSSINALFDNFNVYYN